MKTLTPQTILAVLAATGLIIGAGATSYGHFEKTNHHKADMEQISDRERSAEIRALQARRDDYQYQLLSQQLSDPQREWINAQIKKLNMRIDCLQQRTC